MTALPTLPSSPGPRAQAGPAAEPERDGPPLRVLTWHQHGGYLSALARVGHELVLPMLPGRPHPYGGRGSTFAFPDAVTEIPVEQLGSVEPDVVLYQSRRAWSVDRLHVLTEAQRACPSVYLEHDPPRSSPFDELHPVQDPGTVVVHVTHFNRLMWRNVGPTVVIEHGVEAPRVRWTGELERGLVIVNHMPKRGRRLGLDVFEAVSRTVPLDLVGMGSETIGGLGEVHPLELPAFAARYRFLFNPIRWTSLGLAVCEAMHVGLPVVGLATTEMATAVTPGVSGWVDTDVDTLIERMRHLLSDWDPAARLSVEARRTAHARFGIERFAADWDRLLRTVAAGWPVTDRCASPRRDGATLTAPPARP